MRTLFYYTAQTIRRNRRTSLSVMASVLLASTLLCAMCIFLYTQLRWRVEIEEYQSGQWHGELGGEIPADLLSVADGNLYVEATMIKGPFTCLALPGESRLPYLLLRDADENYWRYMGEKNSILEGRVPERPGEIVVSRSFFEQNPEYRLGDTVRLPEGERWKNDVRLDETQAGQEGETFRQSGEAEVTLVGSTDITTNTTVPGYYAMGYLDRASLTGQEELVIYVKLKDIRRTYEVLPEIAEAMGIGKDEYGRYENHFEYHTLLLALNFVFPPEARIGLKEAGGFLVYGALVLLAAGAFAMMICGAFWVSASARMKQLGMFRSVGATPGQIAASVLMEGILLSVFPILLSLGIGYLFTYIVVGIYTNIAGDVLYFPVTVHFSPVLAVCAAALSFLTVLLAAFWPAVRAARLSPMEAIRMQGGKPERAGRRRKRARHGARPGTGLPRMGLSGYERELARATHRANRRELRPGMLALVICLMLLLGFFPLMRLNDFLSARNWSAGEYNIYGRLDMAAEADRELLSELLAVPGEEKSVYYCVTRLAYWASEDEETDAFREKGGFAGLDPDKWELVNRDGACRIRVYLYGIQEERFDEYCRGLGCDPAEFYRTDQVRAVAQSLAPVYPDVVNNASKSGISYSHLKLFVGEELSLLEKTEDSMESSVVIPVEVGAVAEAGPELDDTRNSYTICLYVPLAVYYSVAERLSGERAGGYSVYVKVKTAPEDDRAVTDRIRELCESVMAGEDVYITSTATEREENAAAVVATETVVDCIGLLLLLIGVSNTVSAVSQIMLRRRREFAMLRSVGMDADGVSRLLMLEGIRMAVMPVLAAVPVTAVLLWLLMGVVDVSWREFLPWMPWGKMTLCVAAVTAAVALSYRICSGRIRRDTIIDAVREENV